MSRRAIAGMVLLMLPLVAACMALLVVAVATCPWGPWWGAAAFAAVFGWLGLSLYLLSSDGGETT